MSDEDFGGDGFSGDEYTEVTEESWFSRLGNAFFGILIGGLMFLVAFPLLFWNEGRAVKQYKTLREGGGAVISAQANAVDPKNAGKLIHVTGKADTKETLADPVFNVSANALKLVRDAEMYQWRERTESEKRKKLGGGTETVTVYRYDKAWSGSLINSSGFKKSGSHRNPSSMPYSSEVWTAKNATLGQFKLPASLVGKIGRITPLPPDTGAPMPTNIQGNVIRDDSGFYVGQNPQIPQIGDMRIRFRVVEPTTVSVVAAQQGQTFAPYQTRAGGTIELLKTGVHSPEEMFQQAQAANTMMTWILRVVGFVVMMIGLNLIMKPLSVFADVLPILGNIVGAGTFFIAFMIAAGFSMVTIAIAWITFRPLLAGGLIAGAVAIGFLVIRRSGKTPAAA